MQFDTRSKLGGHGLGGQRQGFWLGFVRDCLKRPGSFRFRAWQGLALMLAVCLVNDGGVTVCCGQSTEAGSSSRQNREHASQLIPYAQLNEATRTKVSEVVDSASLYRRLPLNSISADPEYFRFLVRYPEVIVNIWQLMGVTQMTTQRTGPFTVDTDDGAGTVSTLDLIYGNDNLHIFFGTGTYEGPVFKRKLNGRCVLILRTDYRKDRLGQDLVVNQMDVFLKLDNVGANLMAKTIQPIVGPTADQNFSDSLKFVQRLNQTTAENGPGVQHMAGRLNIDDDIRERFVEAAGALFERASTQRVGLDSMRIPSLAGGVNSTSTRGASSPAAHATMVDTVGYSYHNQAPQQSIRGNYHDPADQPIPAYRPSPSYSAPAYPSQVSDK